MFAALGLSDTATESEVRKAYHRMAILTHPDMPGGSAAKFREVEEAYAACCQNVRQRIVVPSADNDSVRCTSATNVVPSTRKRVHRIDIDLVHAFTGTAIPVPVEDGHVVYIDVWPGIDSGERVPMPNGDTVRVDVRMPDGYTRRGLDLHYEIKLTLKQALCGFKEHVPHPRGTPVEVASEEGQVVGPSSEYRCPGLGMSRGAHTGDLVLTFAVEFPDALPRETAQAIGCHL